jgi:uncharacterized membrane protein
MEKEKAIPYGLKITFLVHVIVGGIFGLAYLLIPQVITIVMGFSAGEPALSLFRVIGAAILGFAASSWFCYRQTLWERVKIVVQMEIVWTILGALASAWGVVSGAFPATGWMNAIILAAFAIAFIAFYSRK